LLSLAGSIEERIIYIKRIRQRNAIFISSLLLEFIPYTDF